MIDDVKNSVSDYKAFVENYIHKSCTIGGMMIFPKHSGSINQVRGTNRKLCDRWDLALECIRRYYRREDSPLYSTIVKDEQFFNLFVDFKGFVDYFFLQDCVSDDYDTVKILIGDGNFCEDPLPKTVNQYLNWIDIQLSFVEARNRRIAEYLIL